MIIGGVVIVVVITAILFSQKWASEQVRKGTPSSPPHRNEMSSQPGFSKDGYIWKSVPDNVVKAVQTAVMKEGYDLQQFWDPIVNHESGKWSFVFHGTMPDPGFSLTVVFDQKTEAVEFIPGA